MFILWIWVVLRYNYIYAIIIVQRQKCHVFTIGWRDDKILQNALNICALSEATYAARGAAPR